MVTPKEIEAVSTYAEQLKAQFMQNATLKEKSGWLNVESDFFRSREEADAYFGTTAVEEKTLPIDKKSDLFDIHRTKFLYVRYGSTIATEETVAIATIEETDQTFNVCMTQVAGNPGRKLHTSYPQRATQLYKILSHGKIVSPDEINWYCHIPSADGSKKEKFAQIDLHFKDGEFVTHGPEGTLRGEFLASVPAAIKMALFKADRQTIHNVPKVSEKKTLENLSVVQTLFPPVQKL